MISLPNPQDTLKTSPMKIQKSLLAACLGGLLSASLFAAGDELDTAKIDEITGLKGKLNKEEGVY